MKFKVFQIMSLMLALTLFAACASDDDDDDEASAATGELGFTTNGEEFIRDGFTTMDGWDISFDNFYVNIYGPTAYQVAVEDTATERLSVLHAGHPHTDIAEGTAHIALVGSYFVDLKQGTGPAPLDTIDNAPIGNYNYVNFDVKTADADTRNLVDEYQGYSIVMIGNAVSDTTEVSFTIKLNEEIAFSACGPVGEDGGVVEPGGRGEIELTFHSDHIFGDADYAVDDPDSVNPIAIGFTPFAALAVDGLLDVTEADLESGMDPAVYEKLIEAVYTLGHTGEAHCNHEPLTP